MDEATLLQNYSYIVQTRLRTDDYARCLVFREKLYGVLKLKLYRLVQRTFDSWQEASIEARNIQSSCRIPPTGGFESVDPSNLLILISGCDLFDWNIRQAVFLVKELRNICYGHIPDLVITDTFIRNKLAERWCFRQLNFQTNPFQAVVRQIDQLAADL